MGIDEGGKGTVGGILCGGIGTFVRRRFGKVRGGGGVTGGRFLRGELAFCGKIDVLLGEIAFCGFGLTFFFFFVMGTGLGQIIA